jgi:uncharacterized protein YneF (UPF0154 family)
MSNYPQDEKSSSSKTVIIIVSIIAGVVLLIVAVCGGLAYFAVQTIQKTVQPAIAQMQPVVQDLQNSTQTAQSFVTDVSQGQLDEAYELTSAHFKKTMSAKGFKDFVAKHPELNNSTISAMNPSQGGAPMTQMTIPFTLAGPKGPVNGTLRVIKENDAWKVDQFTIP